MLAEHEVFIGPVALVPYETPGTQACADAVVPLAARHNTILMANHGVVTWADNLVHAEWFVEVMDTTCRVLMLAAQAGLKPQEIPPATVGGLLAIKRTLGLPDARFGGDQPEARHGHAGRDTGAHDHRHRDEDAGRVPALTTSSAPSACRTPRHPS